MNNIVRKILVERRLIYKQETELYLIYIYKLCKAYRNNSVFSITKHTWHSLSMNSPNNLVSVAMSGSINMVGFWNVDPFKESHIQSNKAIL